MVPLRLQGTGDLVPLCEAFLFDASKPLTLEQLASSTGISIEIIQEALLQLEYKLETDDRGLSLARLGRTVQLAIKPNYQAIIDRARQTDTERVLAVVREYLHTQRLRGRRPGTLRAYEWFLTRFVEDVGRPIEEIRTRDVRFFLMGEESRGNKRSTIATKTAMLRAFFAWCETEELVDGNPMRKIESPKTGQSDPKYLTHEELELIREACTNHLDRCILEVLYGSGLRVSEVAALDWSDVDWQEKTITVRDGKGGKSRIVPMSTRAALLLRRLRDQRVDDDPCVFRSQMKRRMHKTTLERRVAALGERAHLNRRVTPHHLRHSLATHMLESGAPIDVVQSILGHSDISTTQIYARTQRSTVEMWYRRVIA